MSNLLILNKDQPVSKFKQVWQTIIHTKKVMNNITFGIANTFAQKIKNKNKLH